MGKIDNYYFELVEKLQGLIAKSEWVLASKLLEEELQTPYIPQPYFDQLKNYYNLVSKQQQLTKTQTEFSRLTKPQALARIYDQQNFNASIFSFFLTKFRKELELDDMIFLNQVFKSKTVGNADKLFCLTQLKLLKIDYEFDFYNININRIFIISPTSNFLMKNQPFFTKLTKALNNLSFKNPSVNLMEKQIVEAIYEYFFNSTLNFEINVLAKNIHSYVENLLENKVLVTNEMMQWIDDAVNNRKLKS